MGSPPTLGVINESITKLMTLNWKTHILESPKPTRARTTRDVGEGLKPLGFSSFAGRDANSLAKDQHTKKKKRKKLELAKLTSTMVKEFIS